MIEFFRRGEERKSVVTVSGQKYVFSIQEKCTENGVFASYANEVERWIYPLPIAYRQEKGHPVFAGRAIGISEPEDPALTEI